MAAEIVWEVDSEDPELVYGRVNGIMYYRIYRDYGLTQYTLQSSLPVELTQNGRVDTIAQAQTRAENELAKFLAILAL